MDNAELKKLEETDIPRNDGIMSTGIYLGTFNNLLEFDPGLLPWNHLEENEIDCGDHMTLGEISEFFNKNGNPYHMITVFLNGPQHGMIYQYGNYDDSWVIAGRLNGYN